MTPSSHSYDQTNRLTQVTEGSLTTQFAYNGDGVRTSKTVAGDTTQYVLDLATTLPVVISDTEAVYLYGLDIIAEQLAGAERYYYLHDGLGSVRQLVDTAGEIETSYAYDPFGAPVMGGEVYNPYQFTGEAWDGEVELLYLRARYYQSETGRFTTKDPWAGDVSSPGTFNGYVYVQNDPVNRVDPSGMQEPQPRPTPGPQPGSTPTPWHVQTPIADELARVYGIEVRGAYAYYATLEWKYTQLKLVERAVSDFTDLMQGKAAGFRAKLAPVGLHRAEEGTTVWGAAGMTYLTHITLSGATSHWQDDPYMKWVIVHELAHWWDQKTGHSSSYEMVATRLWSDTGCRTPGEPGSAGIYRVRDWNPWHHDRPNLNPGEDWADSVATYVYWEYAGRVRWQISWSRWSYVGEEMDAGNWQEYHEYPSEWRSVPFGYILVKHGRIVQ